MGLPDEFPDDVTPLPHPSSGRPNLPGGFLTARQEESLLVLLLRAVDTEGLLISATTSVANRLAEPTERYMPQDALLAYLPGKAAHIAEIGRALTGSTVSHACIADLQEFCSRIAAVRSATQFYGRSAPGLRQKSTVHIEVLSGAWRDLCEHAVTLVRSLHLELPEASRPAPSSLRSIPLLVACANGKAPCVMEDGSVEIAGWVERRRDPRWIVAWPATVFVGPYSASAQLTNISRSGFALTTSEILQTSDQICVALKTGDRLSGIIRWARSGTYGIELAAPLDSTHHIIRAAKNDCDRK